MKPAFPSFCTQQYKDLIAQVPGLSEDGPILTIGLGAEKEEHDLLHSP